MSYTEEAPHILVVDDDQRLRDLLKRYLAQSGYLVTSVKNAKEARGLLSNMDFDLVVLDVMMPGETGVELAHDMRKTKNNVPILFLTALGEAKDRIAGLEAGGDDYLPKPFEPRELVLRIQSILRRREKPASAGMPSVESVFFGDFRFSVPLGELTKAQDHIYLTTAEIALMRNLALRANDPIARDDLVKLAQIEGGERAVDVQVTRLRRKIEENPSEPRYLQTVRGIGYVLKADRILQQGAA